jgi:hypothetical protein
MKKLSLKSKIVTGVVVASVIGSSTFAFANTNAGTQFTAWGQAQIDAAKGAVRSSLATELANQQTAINSKASTDKAAAEGKINQAGTDEKADTKSKIEAKLADHVASLRTALQTFLAAIGGDFDTLVSASNSNTTSTLNHQYNQLNADITTVLNAAKAANVKSVTDESLAVKGRATSDLIKEINSVKQQLADRIKSEKDTATSEVLGHLTSEVTRINNLLDTLIAGLENTAKSEIAAAGKAVEDSAIANFERVINLTQTKTPILVDEQKLDWVAERRTDGSIKFTVTNKNEFDVVYRYTFLSNKGFEVVGIDETKFAEDSATPGVSTRIFDTETLKVWGIPVIDVGGILFVQYLDENGNWVTGTEIGLY